MRRSPKRTRRSMIPDRLLSDEVAVVDPGALPSTCAGRLPRTRLRFTYAKPKSTASTRPITVQDRLLSGKQRRKLALAFLQRIAT